MHVSNSEEYRIFFYPFCLPYAFYTPLRHKFPWNKWKIYCSKSEWVQDLSTKSYGFHALTYLIFWDLDYTSNEFLNIYVKKSSIEWFHNLKYPVLSV